MWFSFWHVVFLGAFFVCACVVYWFLSLCNLLQILITPTNEAVDIGANTTELVNHSNHTIGDGDHFELTKWEFIKYVWFIFHWLAMSHCCYNPIIYCYMNARFRIGFLQMLYFIPGVRRCCCINAYTRDRSTSLRTGIALTGKL